VDYLFPNFEEAKLLTGKETLDEIADSFLELWRENGGDQDRQERLFYQAC
jgi:sugar/nucleoside kinase (ribokinase family)